MRSPKRTKRRKPSSASRVNFFATRPVQMLAVRLPEVANYLTRQNRLAIVLAAKTMIAEGISHNHSARAFSISPATLVNWFRAYENDGPRGLEPRPLGPGKYTRRLRSCQIDFTRQPKVRAR